MINIDPTSLVGFAMADLKNKRLGDGSLGQALIPRAQATMDLADTIDREIASCESRETALHAKIADLQRELCEVAAERVAYQNVVRKMRAGPARKDEEAIDA